VCCVSVMFSMTVDYFVILLAILVVVISHFDYVIMVYVS